MIFPVFLSPVYWDMHPHPPCSVSDLWSRDSRAIVIIKLIIQRKSEEKHSLFDSCGRKKI